jgi:hypothetical protein
MQPTKQPALDGATVAGAHLARYGIRVERKHFTFDLRENVRGRFLRITEEVGGRFDTIIIPLSGIEPFRDGLNKMIEISKSQAPGTQVRDFTRRE